MDKFTKANAFKFLNDIVGELLETDNNGIPTYGSIAEIKEEFLSQIKENFEPQAGGGASKNPSYMNEDTGTMMHYCRFKQEFRPEDEMNMFQGKSKGASKLAAKHDYELGKKVAELKAEALKQFTEVGDYTAGADANMEAEKLDASRKLATTFCDENIQYIADKEAAKEAESNKDTANAGTNEASEEAVETTTEES